MMSDSVFIRENHEDMVTNRRYGKLTIQYEAGRVVVIKKEETLKPKELIERKRVVNIK